MYFRVFFVRAFVDFVLALAVLLCVLRLGASFCR